jgi:hypothetical protein
LITSDYRGIAEKSPEDKLLYKARTSPALDDLVADVEDVPAVAGPGAAEGDHRHVALRRAEPVDKPALLQQVEAVLCGQARSAGPWLPRRAAAFHATHETDQDG